jgi:hypothetical protein
MSTLPKHSNIIGAPKKNTNLEMFLQPCKDEGGKKTYYRVRLLAFGSKTGRDDPHITRFVHTGWQKDPKTGKNRMMKVVCPSHTPWVEVEGNKSSSCKICNYVNQQWSIYNESGKTDTTARSHASSAGRKFEAVVPVYVKNDPNYEKNNGKFKVIIFNDKDQYMKFRTLIDNKVREVPVFNGGAAVDCLIHVSRETLEKKNGGTFYRNVIDKITFSTEPKEIPAINSKNIDSSFPFDATYYCASDNEEIIDFYNKFCAISNDDIPEDDDIPVYKSDSSSSTTSFKIPANEEVKASSTDDISTDDINDLIDDSSSTKKPEDTSLAADPDDEGLDVDEAPAASAKSGPSPKSSDDDILAELGF